MASIRPMAAAVMSSSNVSTPMATVMPTTAAMSESEFLLNNSFLVVCLQGYLPVLWLFNVLTSREGW